MPEVQGAFRLGGLPGIATDDCSQEKIRQLHEGYTSNPSAESSFAPVLRAFASSFSKEVSFRLGSGNQLSDGVSFWLLQAAIKGTTTKHPKTVQYKGREIAIDVMRKVGEDVRRTITAEVGASTGFVNRVSDLVFLVILHVSQDYEINAQHASGPLTPARRFFRA